MNKCDGCGCVLQNSDETKEGYVKDLAMSLCERCFRIRHYNEYLKVDKDNSYFLDILKKIDKTNDLVLLVVDFLNMDFCVDIKNPVILVLNKRDLIPRGIDEIRLLDSIKTNLNVVFKVTLGSKNNYNMDLLYEAINKYKKSMNVYVVGYTNAGKSSLINKIIKNYGAMDKFITTSSLPSTTLDLIETKINDDLVLYDTPGLLDEGSIILSCDNSLLKRLTPSKEIRPVTIQVKRFQSIFIDDVVRIDVNSKTNLIFYVSNDLKIERFYKDTNRLDYYVKHNISIKSGYDLVIKGLGFIKVTSDCDLVLYLDKNVKYMIRQSII